MGQLKAVIIILPLLLSVLDEYRASARNTLAYHIENLNYTESDSVQYFLSNLIFFVQS